jgi:DNA invertase Pin-like site-specific DNA recombinase
MKNHKEEKTDRLLGLALVRVSTAEQAKDDHAGLPAQREAIRRTAQRHGIDIVKTFELADISGARVRFSAEYREFLQQCGHPGITCVVTKEFSRLMRPERFEDWAILQHFADNGIALYFPDRVINLAESAAAKLMAGIEAGVAGFERLQIMQRIHDAKEELRKKGYHPSAEHTLARGIGFTKKLGWYYDDEEIASVRLLFRLFLGGEHKYFELSKLTGISRSSVPVILTNPVYAGWMIYDKRHDLSPAGAMYPSKDGKRVFRRKIPRAPEDVIRVRLPLNPIVTEAQHEAIKAIVETKRRHVREAVGSHMPRFTYRGHVFCSECGGNVYTHTGGSLLSGLPKDFYSCKTRHPRLREARAKLGLPPNCSNGYMSRHKLEPVLDAILAERLSDRAFLMPIIEAHLAKIGTASGMSDDELLAARIESLRRKRDRILEGFFDGNIARDQKDERIKAVDDEIRTISDLKLPKCRPELDAQQIVQIVSTFAEWPFLNMAQKRALLSRMLPQIFIYRYEVKGVILRFPSFDGDSVTHPKSVGSRSPAHR